MGNQVRGASLFPLVHKSKTVENHTCTTRHATLCDLLPKAAVRVVHLYAIRTTGGAHSAVEQRAALFIITAVLNSPVRGLSFVFSPSIGPEGAWREFPCFYADLPGLGFPFFCAAPIFFPPAWAIRMGDFFFGGSLAPKQV